MHHFHTITRIILLFHKWGHEKRANNYAITPTTEGTPTYGVIENCLKKNWWSNSSSFFYQNMKLSFRASFHKNLSHPKSFSFYINYFCTQHAKKIIRKVHINFLAKKLFSTFFISQRLSRQNFFIPAILNFFRPSEKLGK